MEIYVNIEVQNNDTPGYAITKLFGLVRDGILTMAEASKRAGVNIHDFEKAYNVYCKIKM